MKYILILSLLSLVMGYDLGGFKYWAQTYDKTYATPEEALERFEIWQSNMLKIELLNAQSENMTYYEENEFADLTHEEFMKKYTGFLPLEENLESEPMDEVLLGAPNTFDWRSKNVITAVKNQGQCGSCWAFAITEDIESVCMIKHGKTVSGFSPLSPQQVVDCDSSNAGCNGGDPTRAYRYVANAGGLNTDASYPYTAKKGSCRFNKGSALCPISGYKLVTGSENQMASTLSSVAPFSIAVDASNWQFYKSGVLLSSNCAKRVNHAVQMVGYNLDGSTPYWIVRNSWGTGWGVSGYINLQYGANTCGLNYQVTYPVAK